MKDSTTVPLSRRGPVQYTRLDMLARALYAYRKFDWTLFASAFMLTSLGLLALYSIGLGQDDSNFTTFKKQLLFLAMSVVLVFAVGAILHYRWLSFVTRPIYLGMMLLLLAVLAFGRTIRGTTGWLYLGPAGFQPVELAKIVLIIIMARYLSVHGRYSRDIRVVIQSAVTVALMILLVVLQPDLGGAVVLAAVWFVMIAVSGLKWSHFLTMIAVAVAVGAISWLFLLRPYQKERIFGFLDPASDPFGRGYNVTQSVIAIGAGQFAGRGVASGSQSQLRFLPEAPTDFIFSVIAEELGFVGITVLFGLFSLILWRLYRIARACQDDFGLFVVIGAAALLVSEVFINVGVASGILPVTGITLPFVSYGGSSLIIHFLMIALVENIAMRRS